MLAQLTLLLPLQAQAGAPLGMLPEIAPLLGFLSSPPVDPTPSMVSQVPFLKNYYTWSLMV